MTDLTPRVSMLKPCPFCGGQAETNLIETFSLDSSYYVISCCDCPAMMRTGSELTMSDIANWNRRPSR